MFITFEGIEGAGKSTVLRLLAEKLQASGDKPVLTREPGGSSLGRNLRPILLDARTRGLSPLAELFLFLADRAQHVRDIIHPALERNQTVLCDRYTDSTLAYQGYGRGQSLLVLQELNQIAAGDILPNLTFLLDLPVSVGIERAIQRNHELGAVVSEGRFDSENLDFHERVRKGYLELAHKSPDRICIVNALDEPESILQNCLSAMEKFLSVKP